MKSKKTAAKKKGSKSGRPDGDPKEYLGMWIAQDPALAKDADRYADLLKLAVLDRGFRRRLIANTTAVLKEFGIVSPKHLKIKVVDNNDDTLHLMIPRLRAVVKGSCSTSLEDWDLKSIEEKKICMDDFNRGNGGFGDQRDADGHSQD